MDAKRSRGMVVREHVSLVNGHCGLDDRERASDVHLVILCLLCMSNGLHGACVCVCACVRRVPKADSFLVWSRTSDPSASIWASPHTRDQCAMCDFDDADSAFQTVRNELYEKKKEPYATTPLAFGRFTGFKPCELRQQVKKGDPDALHYVSWVQATVTASSALFRLQCWLVNMDCLEDKYAKALQALHDARSARQQLDKLRMSTADGHILRLPPELIHRIARYIKDLMTFRCFQMTSRSLWNPRISRVERATYVSQIVWGSVSSGNVCRVKREAILALRMFSIPPCFYSFYVGDHDGSAAATKWFFHLTAFKDWQHLLALVDTLCNSCLRFQSQQVRWEAHICHVGVNVLSHDKVLQISNATQTFNAAGECMLEAFMALDSYLDEATLKPNHSVNSCFPRRLAFYRMRNVSLTEIFGTLDFFTRLWKDLKGMPHVLR